ncbi:casein kinase I [Arthrobotrys conoides]|uniref:non-specific serine/threonine protein kinase n=1 Tax=Arthrobotrys conoides TaxID=74498 RepID=A0AAN8PDU9_9PEZI
MHEQKPPHAHEESPLNSKYVFLEGRIGRGRYATTFLCDNVTQSPRTRLVVKVEFPGEEDKLLRWEYDMYRNLKGIPGIPCIHDFLTDVNGSYLFMDPLGPNMDDILKSCGGQFSQKTTVAVGLQMLDRIESVHQRGILHRDIKPSNFVTGGHQARDQIFLLDFGLSAFWKNTETNEHIPHMREEITGPLDYCSINIHEENLPSRRDELESLCYMLIYFLKGSLPWQMIEGPEGDWRHNEVGRLKKETLLADLCSGIPIRFQVMLEYVRELEYDAQPDYQHLRNLIQGGDLIDPYNHVYDWAP